MIAKISVTVLGSGGPISNRHRASSGYVIAINEQPRILVDAGGGTFERLGRGELDFSALELVLLTHMHIDHTSDLPAIVMDLYMRGRNRPIALAGPAGTAQPGAIEFVDLLFGSAGAWRYMNTFDGFRVEATEIPSGAYDPRINFIAVNKTLERIGVSVCSIGVPHGMMPAAAFRIECDGKSIVFSGDISGSTPALVELAKDCNLLVHDFALPEREVPNGDLHAKPSVVGRTARECGAKALLLSHFMPLIENELDDAVDIVRREYSGTIEIASDLNRYDVE
jgi:ribonuclease BN (tRNA processing enzyme)